MTLNNEKVLFLAFPNSEPNEVREIAEKIRQHFPKGLGYEIILISKDIHLISKKELLEALS